MAVSTRTRFEVFKRDGFTCKYCGRSRDEDGVKLHVDHVIPRKEGGGDEIENLVTACQDCNFGKAAKLLDDRAPVDGIDQQLEAMRERRAKVEAYEEEKRRQKKLTEGDFETVWNYWFEVWGVKQLEKWYVPWENVLRGYIKSIGVEEIKEAMEITAAKFPRIKTDAVRYFNGVCKRKVAEVEGRAVLCTHCEGRIILTREQADSSPNRDYWIHGECKKERAALELADVDDDEPEEYTCDGCHSRPAEAYMFICSECRLAEETITHDEIAQEIKEWDELAEAAGF